MSSVYLLFQNLHYCCFNGMSVHLLQPMTYLFHTSPVYPLFQNLHNCCFNGMSVHLLCTCCNQSHACFTRPPFTYCFQTCTIVVSMECQCPWCSQSHTCFTPVSCVPIVTKTRQCSLMCQSTLTIIQTVIRCASYYKLKGKKTHFCQSLLYSSSKQTVAHIPGK